MGVLWVKGYYGHYQGHSLLLLTTTPFATYDSTMLLTTTPIATYDTYYYSFCFIEDAPAGPQGGRLREHPGHRALRHRLAPGGLGLVVTGSD